MQIHKCLTLNEMMCTLYKNKYGSSPFIIVLECLKACRVSWRKKCVVFKLFFRRKWFYLKLILIFSP